MTIRQNHGQNQSPNWPSRPTPMGSGNALPDFRNAGTLLRIVSLVHLAALMHALATAPDARAVGERFLQATLWIEPPLLAVLSLFWLARDWLWRLPSIYATPAIAALVSVVVLGFEDIWRFLGFSQGHFFDFSRSGMIGALLAAVTCEYFRLRGGNLPRAIQEARMEALTARIRPHFLFNSLNTVLGLIRSQPARAEQALESLAELFRALLHEPRDLVPLSEEIALTRDYLELEGLRLGERLEVVWEVSEIPADTWVPPLLLQVLLENAVRHGIEPREGPGRIVIRLGHDRSSLRLEVENPLPDLDSGQEARHGHHLGLSNLRERLALFYDCEAEMQLTRSGKTFVVVLRIPLNTPSPIPNSSPHSP